MRGGVGVKKPKNREGDLVSCVSFETMVWGDDRRLLVQVDDMEVVGRLHVCQREGSGQGLCQKPETELS